MTTYTKLETSEIFTEENALADIEETLITTSKYDWLLDEAIKDMFGVETISNAGKLFGYSLPNVQQEIFTKARDLAFKKYFSKNETKMTVTAALSLLCALAFQSGDALDREAARLISDIYLRSGENEEDEEED